jgi:hypothetical protein
MHEQQFGAALEGEDDWETSLVVENETMGETMIVIIDYSTNMLQVLSKV